MLASCCASEVYSVLSLRRSSLLPDVDTTFFWSDARVLPTENFLSVRVLVSSSYYSISTSLSVSDRNVSALMSLSTKLIFLGHEISASISQDLNSSLSDLRFSGLGGPLDC